MFSFFCYKSVKFITALPQEQKLCTCADDTLCMFFCLVLLFGVGCSCLSSKWSFIWLNFLWPCSFPRNTGFPHRMPATSNPCTPPPSMEWKTWSAWGTWMRQEFSGTCWFATGNTSSMWVSTSTSGSAPHPLLSLALENPCGGEPWLNWASRFPPHLVPGGEGLLTLGEIAELPDAPAEDPMSWAMGKVHTTLLSHPCRSFRHMY